MRTIRLGWAAAPSAVAFLATAWTASQPSVSLAEERCFHRVNRLPAGVLPLVWPVMQGGSLGAVLVAGAVAAGRRERRLAVRLVVGGSTTWLLAKGVKHLVRRGRPCVHVADRTVRGRPQAGLGFPSGHAAVAVTLATLAAPVTPRRWWPVVWVGAGTVALGRVYVGAHLPLDVVGGAALGHAVGALADALGR